MLCYIFNVTIKIEIDKNMLIIVAVKIQSMLTLQTSLYSEEMMKKNLKYENTLKEFQLQMEEQDKKMAQLQFLLNGQNLKLAESEKENKFMQSKLRFMEKNGGMQITGSIGMARMPSTTTQLNGANIGMEDEPEEFNNTYLVDIKNGTGSLMSLDKNDIFSARELQKRNSMYPQQMRASYALYDMDRLVGEQEMKVRTLDSKL